MTRYFCRTHQSFLFKPDLPWWGKGYVFEGRYDGTYVEEFNLTNRRHIAEHVVEISRVEYDDRRLRRTLCLSR